MLTRILTMGIIAIGANAPLANAQDDARARAELEKLQGVWSIVAMEIEGSPVNDEVFKETQIIVKGNTFKTLAMGTTYGGTVVVDPTQTPKRLELRFTEGPEQGVTGLAIYNLDGDKWTLCVGLAGRDRPTAFSTSAGSGHALETLRRVTGPSGGENVNLESSTLDRAKHASRAIAPVRSAAASPSTPLRSDFPTDHNSYNPAGAVSIIAISRRAQA